MNPILESIHPDKEALRRRQANGLAQLVPALDAFTAYLHEEMRACYLNGHDHAALVTACALLDSAIKDAIHFDVFIQANCIFDGDEWDKIDGLRFGDAINLAKKRTVVSKEEWERLEWLRKHVRNVYMHGQTPHWIKDKSDTIVEGNLRTGEAREITVSARENIVLQRHVRIAADRNVCDQVIRLVDWFVRILTGRAMKRLQEWRQANASRPTREQVDRVLHSMQEQGIEADLIITSEYPDDVPTPPENTEREDRADRP